MKIHLIRNHFLNPAMNNSLLSRSVSTCHTALWVGVLLVIFHLQSAGQVTLKIPVLDAGDSICIIYVVEVQNPFPSGVGQVNSQDTLHVFQPMLELPSSDPDSFPVMFKSTGTLICNPLAGTLAAGVTEICSGDSIFVTLSGNQTAPEYTQVFLIVDPDNGDVISIQNDPYINFDQPGMFRLYSYNYLTGSSVVAMPLNLSDIDCDATGACCDTTSAMFIITVNGASSGTISADQTICEGDIPTALTGTEGTAVGVLSYQWQMSTVSLVGPFFDIPMATMKDYTPGALTTTTYYHRIDISTFNSFECADTSNVVTIAINTVVAGTIGNDQIICSGDIPEELAVSGNTGSGTLAYQWQVSTIGCEGVFEYIIGAESDTYAPPALSDSRYYRLIVTSTSGVVMCRDTSNCVMIIINNATAGTIADDQVVCGGGDPEAIVETSPAMASGTLSHQWQMSINGCEGDFTNIMDATGENFNPPALSETTFFRRIDFSTIDTQACSDTSNCVSIVINNITAGTIMAEQTICNGHTPAMLTGMAGIADVGTISYQWQISTTGLPGSFADISLATTQDYSPPALTATTYYHRVDVSTFNSVECTDTTNVLEITINNVTAGTIGNNQTICRGEVPQMLSVIGESGSGSLSYQWQVNSTGCPGIFEDIMGAGSNTYAVPALSDEMYYRLIVTSTLNAAICRDTTNCVSIFINSITAGTIGIDETVCEGIDPDVITQNSAAIASGTLSHQWQMSTNGCDGDFTNITDAIGENYNPPVLDETSYFRRIDFSTIVDLICSDTTNCITININTVDAGTIGPDQIICHGDIPATLSSINPAEGAGVLSYQWQESTTGVIGSFSNIMGADNPDFSPPSLMDTMYYRRFVTSQLNMVACSDTSNTVMVTINNITAGTIADDQVVCDGGDPEVMMETSAAMSSGILSHQWQSCVNGCTGDFTDIMNATGEDYDPPVLNETTYYRRIDFSTIGIQMCSDTTNCIMIIANEIDAGEIGSSQTICSGMAPMLLTSISPATGTNTPTYQWQESTTSCLAGFTDVDLAAGATYQPPVLSQSTYYRRIATSTVDLLECRDTSNCIEINVRSINIESVVQECQTPMLYNLRICINYANPGPSGMFNVKVGMSNFGPYDYSDLDINGCLVIMDAGFDPTDGEIFDVTVEDVDMVQSMLCSSTFSFMEGPCFRCPVIGSLTAPSSLCSTDQFALTASGLVFMAMAQNAEENFGIKFVAFPGGIPVNPYTGGIELGVVSFASLSMGNTIAMLNNVNASLLGASGMYTICAILSSAPDLDVECRPFQSQSLILDAIPVIEGIVSGPAVVCPDLENLPYSIAGIGNATDYQWSLNNANATISGNGNPAINVSFNSLFNGGILSVTASNGCGTSSAEILNIAKASAAFCQFTSCLSENQNLIVDQTLLNMMGSPDVYHAINNLESTATIAALRTIIFKAGNEITLNPPFTVELGATFIAEIEACVYSIQRH